MWRNWQTRGVQVAVSLRSWRFESSHPHQTSRLRTHGPGTGAMVVLERGLADRPRRPRVELVDVEAGGAAVTGDDGAKLVAADDVVDSCEAVGRAFLDDRHDVLRAVTAIGVHEGARRRPAQALVGGQRAYGIGVARKLVGEDAGVDDRLRGAVRADRIHRVRGVAE